MAMGGEASGAVRELRPVREWGLDPMCFAHVRLLGFDLLALRPVPHMQGSFSRKGRPVRKVEIMGIVVAVDRKERYLRFTLDDGTGCVPCILWTNHASFMATTPAKGLELQARQELANGTAAKVKLGEVLRVQGRLSTFANQIQVTVASLQVEQDPNAEVLHWLECMRLAKCCYDLDPPSQTKPPHR
ncbi:hypothetical protein KC19_9G060400 [Ceratodon purpureus]|uniref:CST complex subunit STN1 n=1 Tax=Ceratodon purpureus TaxID=3225 RepID=A0A8T0GSN9_CERPU|nr:hypothetical protein KC19_9G060400 [Ceratodon purpureus]